MQKRVSGRLSRRVIALWFLLLPCLIIGCNTSSNNTDDQPLSEDFVISLNPGNALLLNDATLDFNDGSALFDLASGSTFSLAFQNINASTGTGLFTLISNNRRIEGTVAFVASCAFTTVTNGLDPGNGPEVGDVINFSTCNIVVQSNVEYGDVGTGDLSLDLTRQQGAEQARSETTEVAVEVTTPGSILINSVGTGITIPPTSN